MAELSPRAAMFPPWGTCTACGVRLASPGLDPDGVPRGAADLAWTICTRCACDFCERPAGLVIEHAGRRAQVCAACVGDAIFALADDDGPGAPLVRLAAFHASPAPCGAGAANQSSARGRAPEAGHSIEDARARAGQFGSSGAVAGPAEGDP